MSDRTSNPVDVAMMRELKRLSESHSGYLGDMLGNAALRLQGMSEEIARLRSDRDKNFEAGVGYANEVARLRAALDNYGKHDHGCVRYQSFTADPCTCGLDAARVESSPFETTVDRGKISDGYHTFDELYDHRCHLFVALMRSNPGLSWRSKLHSDGTGYPSWFIAGMRLVSGDITYHLPLWMWGMLDGISTHDRAPEWDGHTSADVVKRLRAWNERTAEKASEPDDWCYEHGYREHKRGSPACERAAQKATGEPHGR